MALYMGGILLLFSLIGLWYYSKENHRITQENKVAQKLYDSQCQRLERFAPKPFTCKLEKPQTLQQHQTLYFELFGAFIFTLILSALLSFFLAKISLRPMHEANALMDEFIHAMIHDLNTPITSAKLSSESLKNTELTPTQLRKVERIDKSLQRLLGLQKQLRSAIKNVTYDFENSNFELTALLQDFTTYSELITLTCKNDLMISADMMMIERLIENLVSNAIKYNKESNDIIILLEGSKLSIIDRGQGIKDVNRVFEHYYREHSSMSGLGLGLGIVKMVSEHYGLHVKIDSTLHIGTTISLDFTAIATQ